MIQRGPAPWWIAPVAATQASYSGLWLCSGMLGVIAVIFVLVRRHVSRPRTPHAAVELRLPRG